MKITIDFKGFSEETLPSINIDRNTDSVHDTIQDLSENHQSLSHEKVSSAGIVKERLKNKSMEKFLWKERLYFKVGEFYGWLNADNDFTPIGSSCFYNNRRQARHAEK